MAHTIGIIGGADGPTAVFVTGSPLPALLGIAAAIVLVVWIVRHFKTRK